MKVWPLKFWTRPRRVPPHNDTALAIACDECGAAPGEPCAPGCCTAPYGSGGPLEHEHLADAEAELARPCPVCGSPAGVECEPGRNCGYVTLNGRPA